MKIIDHKICNVYKFLNKTSGEFGIEVEMEMNEYIQKTSISKPFWRNESDGSLKGPSTEFVLIKPCKLTEVKDRLSLIKSELDLQKLIIKPTIRAGVHIHLNVQQMTLREVFKFAMVYYMLETAITRYCGENRVGNLFCLRARDAEFVLECIRLFLDTGNFGYLSTEEIRYSALNYNSLSKYGSIEFRSMETRPDLSGIYEFAKIINRIKKVSSKLDLIAIPEKMSFAGPKEWAKEILGDKLFKLLDYPDMEKDIMLDMRVVQPTLYKIGNM